MRLVIKSLAVLLCVITMLLIGLWAMSSSVLEFLATRLAPQYGIADLQLVVDRPQYQSLSIPSVSFVVDQWAVEATAVQIRYAPLQVEFVEIDTLVVRQLTQAVSEPSERDEGLTGDSLGVEQIFALLPPGAINTLDVSLSSIGFSGSGSALLNSEGLSLKIAGLTPDYARHFRVDLLMRPWGDLAFDFFDNQHADTPIVTLTTSIADQFLQADGEFDLTRYPLTLLSEVLAAPQGTGRIAGEFHAKLPWPVDVDRLTDQVVTGALRVDWQSEELGLSVEGLNLALSGTTARIETVIASGKVVIADPDVVLDLPAGLTVNYESDQLIISRGVRYQFVQDATARITGIINELTAKISEPLIITSRLTFNAVVDEYRSSGAVQSKLTFQQDRLQGSGRLERKGYRIPFMLQYDLSKSSGSASSQSTYEITRPIMGDLLDSWVEPYDVHKGFADITTSYAWTPASSQGSTTIKLRDATVHYGDLVASGVNGTFQLTQKNDEIILKRSGFSVGEIDVGLALRDISGEVAGRTDQLQLHQLQASTLGGRVSAAEVVIALEQLDSTFTIELAQIDLAQVLALEGEDVKGTGTLRGTLPIKLHAGEVSVTNGEVSALPPGGKIQLSPSLAVATGQPGVDFALNALTNFDYEKLDVKANYADNGDLTLAVALRGRNPAVEKGRPIHYNLTINENIFALLEALRAQSDVTDRIERKITERNKPRAN